jgi:hypothetical protein
MVRDERNAVSIDDPLSDVARRERVTVARELFREDRWTAPAGIVTRTRTDQRARRRGASGERVAG